MITVPSMPIVSDVARSMPAPSPVAPRQMLPPPITKASSRSWSAHAEAISVASRSTIATSIVSSLDDEASASPDILRTSRRGATQLPIRTWAKATIVAVPSSWVIDCFSSRT